MKGGGGAAACLGARGFVRSGEGRRRLGVSPVPLNSHLLAERDGNSEISETRCAESRFERADGYNKTKEMTRG